jgi:RNA polymerase-binding protein DksA
MKEQELEFFKSRILEKRTELLHELGYLKDSTMSSTPQEASGEHSAYAYHMADLGTDNMEREKAFFYAYRESRLLYHLDQALDRIHKKTYGMCRECDNPISQARLKAVPHATLCIQCKSNEEKKKTNNSK